MRVTGWVVPYRWCKGIVLAHGFLGVRSAWYGRLLSRGNFGMHRCGVLRLVTEI